MSARGTRLVVPRVANLGAPTHPQEKHCGRYPRRLMLGRGLLLNYLKMYKSNFMYFSEIHMSYIRRRIKGKVIRTNHLKHPTHAKFGLMSTLLR